MPRHSTLEKSRSDPSEQPLLNNKSQPLKDVLPALVAFAVIPAFAERDS